MTVCKTVPQMVNLLRDKLFCCKVCMSFKVDVDKVVIGAAKIRKEKCKGYYFGKKNSGIPGNVSFR